MDAALWRSLNYTLTRLAVGLGLIALFSSKFAPRPGRSVWWFPRIAIRPAISAMTGMILNLQLGFDDLEEVGGEFFETIGFVFDFFHEGFTGLVRKRGLRIQQLVGPAREAL